jgi:hypothetical protein
VLKYINQYWAKHLSFASSGNKDLQNAVDHLAGSASFTDNVDGTDAHLVVKWLKVFVSTEIY